MGRLINVFDTIVSVIYIVGIFLIILCYGRIAWR